MREYFLSYKLSISTQSLEFQLSTSHCLTLCTRVVMSVKFRSRPLVHLSGLLSHQPHQISPFLIPFLHNQHRAASILSALSDNPGAYSKKIRRGRGPSSGKGKTSGRGTKGQKARSKVPKGFNGGQTPDHIVNPIRGTDNRNTKCVPLVNLKPPLCHCHLVDV